MGIIMYRTEMWECREREEMEILQKKYVNSSLGLDTYTPDYIVHEE